MRIDNDTVGLVKVMASYDVTNKIIEIDESNQIEQKSVDLLKIVGNILRVDLRDFMFFEGELGIRHSSPIAGANCVLKDFVFCALHEVSNIRFLESFLPTTAGARSSGNAAKKANSSLSGMTVNAGI